MPVIGERVAHRAWLDSRSAGPGDVSGNDRVLIWLKNSAATACWPHSNSTLYILEALSSVSLVAQRRRAVCLLSPKLDRCTLVKPVSCARWHASSFRPGGR